MNIVQIFEQLARTAHHKTNCIELLKEENSILQQLFLNNDASALRDFFSEKAMYADRTTIFDL